MSMICPNCNRPNEPAMNGAGCTCRFHFQSEGAKHNGALRIDDEGQWRHTPWGRMLIGLLLAQGLGYAIQQMLTAGYLFTGEVDSPWNTIWGIVFLHGLQGMALVIGGGLCGAGRRLGVLYGSFVGLMNGLIFMLVQRQTGDLTPIVVYCQPMLHMAFGALGGLLGTIIWKPAPTWDVLPSRTKSHKPLPIPGSYRWLHGKVHMGRVFTGIFIVVVGIVWSNVILDWLLHASEGRLTLKTHFQASLIIWEISALGTLLGAGFAGASTFNGLKHGLCVGFGSSVIYVGIQLGTPTSQPEGTALMVASIMIMTTVGGWFGGQLLPPVHTGKRRGKFAL